MRVELEEQDGCQPGCCYDESGDDNEERCSATVAEASRVQAKEGEKQGLNTADKVFPKR